jgi:hypothetical protein
MKRRIAYLILLTVFAGLRSLGQTVVVTDDNSVTTGDASSVLDVKSTSKGFLTPRMTEAQRTSISNPATGLLVYQTNNITGYYYYDGSGWVIIAKGAGWTASGSNIYYNTGKVGIGNTSPGEALDVTGNIKFSGALMPGNDAGTATYLLTSAGTGAAPTWTNPNTYFESYIWKLDGNNVPSLKKIGTTSNYDLPFITNNTEKMRLTSGGYLGIGVDSPSAPIHVGRTSPTSGITPIAVFEETRDAGLSNSVVMQLSNKSLNSNATKFLIGSSSSNKRWIFGTDKDGNNSQNFFLWDDNSVLVRLYIDGSNGYTGLGTASPQSLFHVYSHLPPSFDVPAALFEGESDGGVVSLALRNNSGARTKTAFIFGGSSNSYQWSIGNDIQGNNEHNFYIYDEGSFNTRFFIDQSGNVGIGNILPTELLDVSGNIKLSGNIVGGSWTGNIVSPTYGGTGVDNGTNTITLGGNFTTSGANNLTLATTGTTNVILPTSGTLVTTAVTTLSSLASIGTITTGTWNGTVISPTYGGTGINNGVKTITLGGNLTTSGAFATTLTTTGTTNVTLPTTGTLVNTSVTTLSSLASIGTITTGTWNGTIVSPAYGGTGINNGTKTITLGDNLATAGAFPLTLTTTGTTNVTLPTSGTLVNSAVTTLPSLASLGTVTTGTWNGTIISPVYGGTGVNNGSNTITLSGNLTVGAVSNISGNLSVTSGKTLTATNSLTLAGTDGKGINIGAATANKFLIGDGSNMVLSASTIPSSAGATANRLLLSDGTNYVLSTPTFPNASATSGKIIKSDGTNWMASTETYPSPSTEGNIMESDGANWSSVPNPSEPKWTTVKVEGSNVTTNTTLADITGLTVSGLTTSTSYEFEAVLNCQSSSNAGNRYAINITNNTPTIASVIYTGAINTTTGSVAATSANNTVSSAFLASANLNGVIVIKGIFTTGASGAATFAIRHQKITSGTSTVRVGSILRVRAL